MVKSTSSVADSQGLKTLTLLEAELMNIIWELKEATVHQVLEKLPKHKSLAYTTVSTILRILEQKKVLSSRKEGRTHVYVPMLKKQDYETAALKQVVSLAFDNSPFLLAKQLIDSQTLTEQEIYQLKQLLDSKK